MKYIFFCFVHKGLDGLDIESLGIPTEEEIVKKYCKDMNMPEIEDWNIYMAFSFFRIAAIAQGVYKRALQGLYNCFYTEALHRFECRFLVF